jgi:PadR family transcriptional regulator PadR
MFRLAYFNTYADNNAMPKGEYLGELELLVLSAISLLGDEAYGVTIRREIDARTGREAPMGVIYSALARLEQKGYIAFSLSDPLPVRGGRARKYARLTPDGVRTLRTSTEGLAKMLNLRLRTTP